MKSTRYRESRTSHQTPPRYNQMPLSRSLTPEFQKVVGGVLKILGKLEFFKPDEVPPHLTYVTGKAYSVNTVGPRQLHEACSHAELKDELTLGVDRLEPGNRILKGGQRLIIVFDDETGLSHMDEVASVLRIIKKGPTSAITTINPHMALGTLTDPSRATNQWLDRVAGELPTSLTFGPVRVFGQFIETRKSASQQSTSA